ncbi:YceH family protein [Parapedobacter sp. 10938]|uniref:YceH family protein n=1 Tax=Parapedobacter flavus TaxID=3110225 RepID=UPI002DBA47E7|nr:YceH family protein [Parapedobacter sp. 10938]MEC3880397.1 YceH family protein [Parapedobacter sp. 10938]
MDNIPPLPILSAEEQRVLGVLMEKSKTTPEYYPLTINALVAGCNQKTSRKPVVQYDDNTVITTLDTLRKKGLASTVIGGSSRVTKFKHNFAIVYPVIPAEVAIICLLLLRGPQTPGELNTNSGRLYEFESLDEVQSFLDNLAHADQPFVQQLPKRPGQKEARYMQLLGGMAMPEEDDSAAEGMDTPSGLAPRLAKVEAELAALRAEFDKLMQELS